MGAAAVAAVTAVAVPTVMARARVEEPAYEVTARHEGFEVRRYDGRIVAEVDVSGAPGDASREGFRILADFIFGNNSRSASVAMTAPVDRTASERIAMTAPVDRRVAADADADATDPEGEWTIAFTMPSKYTMRTLPRPNDDRIRIREIPPTSYAVSRFRGAPSEPGVQRRMAELVEAVRAAGLSPKAGAEPTYARYDPPWTPGFLRRNEIFVELDVVPAS